MERSFRKPLSVIVSAVMVLAMFGILNLAAPAPAIKTAALPYQDTAYTFEERAADLVSRMTLEEKIKQIATHTPAIPRLGVPGYGYWNEALHGVTTDNGETATSFLYSLSMAATWDRELIKEVSTAISDEARSQNYYRNRPMTYFSPTINLSRDPRWGRNHEGYGEDPYLTAQIGQSFIEGFQGDDPKYTKIVATPKHYALNNSEYNRHWGSSNADERDIREYYTRTFKEIILNTDVGSVMSAYNRVNEVPASASRYLMDTLLRKTFGFSGYTVTDCGAIENMYTNAPNNHYWKPSADNNQYTAVPVDSRFLNADGHISPQGAAALSIMAGTDMDCVGWGYAYALPAVQNGLLSEDTVDIALVRIFTQRMKLGEFDPKDDVPYRSDYYAKANIMESPKHVQLAEDSSDQSIVLLKNEKAKPADTKPILPLDPAKKNVVLIGPKRIADGYEIGGYTGDSKPENISTCKQGIEKILGQTITHITGGGQMYIASQVRNIFLMKGDEVVRTLTPNDASSSKGVVKEGDDGGGGGRWGWVAAGCEITYPGVDLTDITAIAVEINGNGQTAGCTLSYSLKSTDGSMTVASMILTSKSGSYPKYDAAIGSLGGRVVGELKLNIESPVSIVAFTTSEQNTIRNADAVIVAIGSEYHDATEGGDRTSFDIRRGQDRLALEACKLNPNTVVYLQTVGVVDINNTIDYAPAILWTCYNGQSQGNAMARIIFGAANPTAKLPFTWYADETQVPTIDDYHIRQDAFEGKTHGGWTYQYFTGDVTYPFGHGLSYTDFEYSNMTISKTSVTPNDTVTVTVDVKNTGSRDSAEVVQVYVVPPVHDGVTRPTQQLRAFDKVKLTPGETKTVTLSVDMAELYFWDETLQKNIYDPGGYTVQIGASCGDIRFERTVNLSGTLAEKLQVVTADPNGVILNVSKPELSINANITACLRDDSFLDLNRSGVSVVYTSSNNAIASVDAKGTVKAVNIGVTTITATVTVNGSTMSASFPVVVKDIVYAEGITINGIDVENFLPNKYMYELTIPAGSAIPPAVTVAASEGTDVTITKPNTLPGQVVVTVKSKANADVSATYYVRLLYPPNNETYIVATFPDRAITRVNDNLWADWIRFDYTGSFTPLDLRTHDPDKLFLRINVNFAASATTVNLDNAFASGTTKLRSTDMVKKPGDPHPEPDNNEHNFGWNIRGDWNLRLGDNYIEIPLGPAIRGAEYETLSTNSRGLMDWQAVERMIFIIDYRSEYAGISFTMSLTDVKIVDITLEEELAALGALAGTEPIAKGEYTDDSYSAYLTAYNAAKAVLEKGTVNNTAAAVRGAKTILQTAIDGLSVTPGTVNKTTLQTLVTGIAAEYPNGAKQYSGMSWGALTQAIQAAQAVLDKADAEQPEVDAAAEALTAAKNALRRWGFVETAAAKDKVTITDARLVLQHLVQKITLTPEALSAAAVNGSIDEDSSPKITITDARLILQKLVGKIDKFPVEK
ncbi:MAG: glycoside hydrolase family 3 C-terminal domain-containing protein [Oscillospiraceae bacterium]|nr:glycoside hydrolase family 3 C-terminal domain-containing protein [Oscillospiraceae bacterium]